MDKKRVLFICTGNSARSQMAEGFGKVLGKSKWEVYSAGIEPKGLNPYAVKVMQEEAIDISQQKSKDIDEELLNKMDLVVTLCDHAQKNCPAVPPNIKTLHWSLPDPSLFTGTEDMILEKFRTIREEIKKRIENLLTE